MGWRSEGECEGGPQGEESSGESLKTASFAWRITCHIDSEEHATSQQRIAVCQL